MVPPLVQPRPLLPPERKPRRSPQPLHITEPQPSWPPPPDPHQHATFEGIDFLTRVRLSATLRGPDFLATIRALGLEPEHFDPHTCTVLDSRMAERFASASSQGLNPVPAELANSWLQNELLLLTH